MNCTTTTRRAPVRRTTLALAATCALFALPHAARAVEFSAEFSGYTRFGTGHTSKDGTQQCFQLPGAQSKYRLGNECEQLAEFDVRKNFTELADGSVLRGEVMAIVANPYGEKNTFRISDGNGGYSRLAQGYLAWDNISWLNGGSIWGGRRYYKRNSVNINDFFYWNNSGTGIGIEDAGIGSGPLKWSYFFSRKDSVWQDPYVNKHDFQLSGIQSNPGGQLQFGLTWLDKASRPGAQSGWQFTMQHKQGDVLGGSNVFAMQYGKGPGIGLGGTGPYFLGTDTTRWRLVEALDWQMGRLGGQATVVFQRDKSPGAAEVDWLSFGVRPVYAITDQIKLSLELGHDRADTASGAANLTKATLAVAWSPYGPKWTQNPEFRLYYTHANWNSAAQAAANRTAAGSALSSTGAFGNARSGGNLGVQVEYSW